MEFQRHTCPSCGAHIEVDPGSAHSTCEYCGQGFSVRLPEPAGGAGASRACLKCGYSNTTDARYCNDCGASLASSERVPQMTITVEAAPPQVGERKVCPFCKEDIAAAAIKCKHCNEYLDGRQRPASSAPRLTTAEIARTWAQRFFQDCPYTLAQLKPWSAYSPDQVKKIAAALKLQAGENGLAVLNETFWGSGKRGVVLTDQRVVWRIGRNKGDVSLSYLNRVEHQYGWFKPKKLWFNKHELDPTYATKDDLAALAELLQRIVSDRQNRGISQGQQREQQRRNWGVAMLQRIAAPAQSGGAKGSSFGLGCLLMICFCCIVPAAMTDKAGKKYSRTVKRAQANQTRKAKQKGRTHLKAAKAAVKKNDPVVAWDQASLALREYGRAQDSRSTYAKQARRLVGEQAALAAPVLLERGAAALRDGKRSEAIKLLQQAQRACADAKKGGHELKVSPAAVEAALQKARGASGAAGAGGASSEDGARGPRPKVSFLGGVRACEPELSRRYPGWRPTRWSALVPVGPHWVVDVELATRSRGRMRNRRAPRRIVQLRVWIQQGRVTDVRELTPGQFGQLKQTTGAGGR